MNGQQVDDEVRCSDGPAGTDSRSLLTIGKNNEKDIYNDFGRFRMDTLIVYYRALAQSEILNVYGEGNKNLYVLCLYIYN